MYTNVDCLSNKMPDLKLFLNSLSNKPNVIAITEVNPKSSKYKRIESEYSLEGYNLFSVNIGDNSFRGIIVYVSQALSATQIYVSTKFNECLLLQLKVDHNNSMLLGTFYRSPSSSSDNDNYLIDTLNELSNKYKCKSLYIGDFNLGNIDWTTCTSITSKLVEMSFLSCLQNNFLLQHVRKPTRARGSDNPHILDLLITNDDFIEDVLYFGPIGKSDHSVIVCNCIVKASREINTEKYNYNKGNYDAFRLCMNRDWANEFSSCDDINSIWNTFKLIFFEGLDKFVPKINSSNWKKKSSWQRPISKPLKQLINRKHRLWRRFQETKSPAVETVFKSVRNKVRAESRKLQKLEEQNIAKACKNNPKKFWQFVKSKTKNRCNVSNIHMKSSDGERVLTEDLDKCDAFADFFSKIYTNEPFCEFDPIPRVMLSNSSDALEITETAIYKKLDLLKIDKSPGPDNIHPRVIYELRSQLCPAFKIIFQLSLNTGHIPDEWKRSIVSVLHKKGNKSSISNYRPISLTCIVCKIMESLIRDQLMEYFLNCNLFSNKQFGFIKGRSTTLQLLNVVDKWTSYLEHGGQIDVIYMDFEKAFDKVPHKRLLSKLESYGVNIEIIKWIEGFLQDRTFSIRINGVFSDWCRVLSGIPQGSVLGPLLFVIFINDLAINFDSDGELYLFADDGKLFRHVKDMTDSIVLQRLCQDFYNWSERWLMKLNIDKCKIISISRNAVSQKYTYGFQTINNEFVELDHVSCIEDLGITVDDKLSFDSHISGKVCKAFQMLGVINRNFKLLDKDTFILLYKSLVRTSLEYGHSIWNPSRVSYISDIEKVQKRATKMVHTCKHLSYVERLKFLQLPTLKFRRIRGDMIEAYKILNYKYDARVVPILCKNVSTRTRGNSLKLNVERSKYNLRKFSFTPRIVNIWNSLPDCVVTADSVNVFKNELDKFWINKEVYYDWKADII